MTPSASIYNKGQWKGQRILIIDIRMHPKDRQIIGGLMQKGDVLSRTNTNDCLAHQLTNKRTVKVINCQLNLFAVVGFFASVGFLLVFTFNYH